MNIYISKRSFHFKLFSLIKRYESFLSKKTQTPENDAVDGMILIKQSPLFERLDNRWRIGEFNFHLHKDFGLLLKLLAKRFILYQLWGSSIVGLLLLGVLAILKMKFSVNIPITIRTRVLFAVFIGAVPVFNLFCAGLLLKFLWQCLYGFINVMKGKDFKGMEVEPSRYLLVYILTFLLIPIWLVIDLLLQVLIRTVLMGIWYAGIGIIRFSEIVWLISNLLLLLGGGILLVLYKMLVPVGKIIIFLFKLPLKILGIEIKTK